MSEARDFCDRCGGPCKVRPLIDSSRFANDLFGFQAEVARCHAWFTPERLAEVERVRTETRALPVIPTFPCVVCQKFAFDRDGVTCYWCGRGVPAEARPAEVLIVVTPAPEPAPATVSRAVKAKPPVIDAPPSLFE